MAKHTELQVQASFLSWQEACYTQALPVVGVLRARKHPPCRQAPRSGPRARSAQLSRPPAPSTPHRSDPFPFCKMGRGRARIWKESLTAPSKSLSGTLKVTESTLHFPLSGSGRRRGRAAAGPPALAPRTGRRPESQPPSCRRTRLTRPPLSVPGTLVPGRQGDAVGGGAGGGRARKWGRGGAERASRDGGVRRRAQGGDSPPRGIRRGARPPRGRWRKKKVTARGAALRLSPQVAGRRGRGARGRGLAAGGGEVSEGAE